MNAACGEFVGDRADVGIDAVHRRTASTMAGIAARPSAFGRDQIAIEFAAFAGADFYGLS